MIFDVTTAVTAAFADLSRQGMFARENFSCCGSCAGYEIANEAEKLVDQGNPPAGSVFYHEQDAEAWDRRPLFLRFGQIETTKHGAVGKPTVEVGQIVVAALKKQGLPVEWSGSGADCIKVMVTKSGWPVPS